MHVFISPCDAKYVIFDTPVFDDDFQHLQCDFFSPNKLTYTNSILLRAPLIKYTKMPDVAKIIKMNIYFLICQNKTEFYSNYSVFRDKHGYFMIGC